MSKIDELIEWNESHAMYYTDNDVVKQTCRDTAAALRLLGDVAVAVMLEKKPEHGPDAARLYRQREAATDTALAALRDAGLIERGG